MKKIGIIAVTLVCIILGIIMFVLCASLRNIIIVKSESVEAYNTPYYSIAVPDKWEVQEHKDLELSEFLLDNQKVASIETYEKCDYASSISSIVHNIFGMHSYIESQETVGDEKDFELVKVVVGYEQSAAETEMKNTPEQKEEHYIWTNYKDTVIDLFIDTTRVKESEKKEIIKTFTYH